MPLFKVVMEEIKTSVAYIEAASANAIDEWAFNTPEFTAEVAHIEKVEVAPIGVNVITAE